MAPYGEPKYVDRIKKLIHIKEDGSFRLHMEHFCFDYGMRMYLPSFEEVMGAPTRPLDSGEMTQFHKDVARSLQEVVNEIMVKLAQRAMNEAGSKTFVWQVGLLLIVLPMDISYERQMLKIFLFNLLQGIMVVRWEQPCGCG